MHNTLSKRQLKDFGLLVGLGFPIVIGWIIPLFGGHSFRTWTLWVGCPLLILGLLAPNTLFYPYKVWMKIGLALGQPMKATKVSTGTLSEIDPFMWEAYYSFRPNDSIEVTPAVFGGSDVYNDSEDDLFGAVLTTTFKF